MHKIVLPVLLRTSFKIISTFVIGLGFIWCINGQESQPWHMVKQSPAQMRQASYVDREQSAKEPETISQLPILNAVFFANNLDGWAVGDNGNVVSTRDGGQTWKATTISPPANLYSIFFHNERQGWAVGDAENVGVILRTEDGGKNWRVQSRIEGFELSGIHSVWFADEQYGWVTGEAQQKGVVQGVILATQDGGIHWKQQYLGKEHSSTLSAIKFVDTQRGWAVGHNVILYTENGGQQWREQRYVQGEYYFDVDFINSTDGWVVGSDGSLLHTVDGGDTWQVRQLPAKYQTLWLASVRFVDSSRGWIAGDEGAILSTNDGGQTWKSESIGTSEYLRGLALTSHSIFAVGNNGIILRRQI